MGKGRIFSKASKAATNWSKTPLPGWWNAFLILCAAGVAVMLLISFFAPATDTQAQTPSGFEQGGTDSSVSAPPTPSDPDASEPADATPAEDSTPDGDVPKEARQVAKNAFWAPFDSARAAETPLAGGGFHQPPAREFPDATVEDFVVVSSSNSEITFAAEVDADGPGTAWGPNIREITVVSEEGQWKVKQ